MNNFDKFSSDIDIDLGDRSKALSLIDHTPASILRDGALVRHNTGIYVTDIPVEPISGISGVEYKTAEERGYIKLDLLNVSLYNAIESDEHLNSLMAQPPRWERLREPQFCSQLIHIHNHHNTLMKMPEPVDSIPRLAMFLALIRPAKRHLIGRSWKEVSKTVWEVDSDGYAFKKAHGVAYAHLVVVNMNLIETGVLKLPD